MGLDLKEIISYRGILEGFNFFVLEFSFGIGIRNISVRFVGNLGKGILE